jgi:anti-sigma-K factor RskA
VSAHDPFRDDAGAYLLGALEDGERRAFEDHLSGCAQCREEVERLAVARDALPRSVDQLAPPPTLKAALMEQVRGASDPSGAPAREQPRRRSRWRELLVARPAAAAAAAVLALGIAAGALVGTLGGDGGGGERTLSAVVDQTRMPAGRATLLLPADGEGAQLRVEGMQQPQAGKVYEVWIKHGVRVTPSSLFTVERDGSGAAAIPHDLSDADAVMVTREPAGGSTRPSEPPVVMVSVES